MKTTQTKTPPQWKFEDSRAGMRESMSTPTPVQPSPGALRAAQSLREDMERRSPAFRPSQHEWDTATAQMIDRETGTAELVQALGELQAVTDALCAYYLGDVANDKLSESYAARKHARAIHAKHSSTPN